MSDPTRALLAQCLDLSSPERAWLAARLMECCYPEAADRFAEELACPWLRRVAEAVNARIDAQNEPQE